MALTGNGESLQTRMVRRIRFDLRMTPQEAIQAGPELDNSDQGWLYAWQAPTEPPQDLVLSHKEGRSRTAALEGVGVSLLIDLPHRNETAVLWSPTRHILNAAVERLRSTN
ncbi:hypothetical protein ACFVUS_26580 [Nocardia sp. NPDC058058]|uniref:hypothetical protein n=1 Tax=Nocardia sp. NPDC058058 TaxID=3346317 RepID=UPI0036DD13FA